MQLSHGLFCILAFFSWLYPSSGKSTGEQGIVSWDILENLQQVTGCSGGGICKSIKRFAIFAL